MLRLLALIPLCSLLAACSDPASTGPGGAGGGGSGGAGTTSSTTTKTWTSTHTVACGAVGAGAGEDQTVQTGAKVTLHGSASSLLCSNTLQFMWTQTAGEPVKIDYPTLPEPTFEAPELSAQLSFTLEVTDEEGKTATDSVNVDVGIQSPVAHAGPDKGALGGATVTLQGAGADPRDLPISFSWKQVSGPTVPLSGAGTDSPTLVLPETLTEPVVYALTINNGYLDSIPDWVTVRRLDGADTDGDLLEDDVEIALGTDPMDADTDHDGIPDGWEVLGHEDVDYAALGCDPLHRDLLVELVSEEYTKNGVLHTARPSATVLAKLTEFYATLPLPTPSPDGLPGIAIHFVESAPLPEDFYCFQPGESCWLNDAPGNFLYREAFHRASLCLGATGGCADLTGRRLSVSNYEQNADPSDELTEPLAFAFYRLFIHEMGHNLSVHHGGDSAMNHKPNYPSVMNYSYFHDDPEATLATDEVRYSRGLMPSLDECAVVESASLAGAPAADLALLETYGGDAGWTAEADGSVDWNRDGTVSTAPYSLTLRLSPGLFPDCALLTDHDDHAAILEGIGPSLPATRTSLEPWTPLKLTPRVSVP